MCFENDGYAIVHIFIELHTHGGHKNEMGVNEGQQCGIYCSAARFLRRSLSSEIVSLMPLPRGSDIHGLLPSPMTKMLVMLQVTGISTDRAYPEYDVPSGKGTVECVFYMNNIEATNMLFAVSDNASTTHAASTGNHHKVTGIKSYKVYNPSLLKVKFDGVVNPDSWVGIPDGPAIMGYNVGNALGTQSNFTDLEEFVGSLLWGDAVDGETALDIIQKAEVFAGFFNGNSVYMRW